MMRKRFRKGLPKGRKAFIASALVDFLWAPITFLLVACIFYFIYSWSAEARLQQLSDSRDVIDGNYLAQVYLRTPLKIGDQDLNMAELIAFYDYNQTLERQKDKSYAEVVQDKFRFLLGKDNPMRQALVKFTDDFVEANFDDSKCYMFAIKGNAITYNYRGTSCAGAKAFDVYYLFSLMKSIPNETYSTYVATVDPRHSPIVILSVYDMEALLDVYSDDPYFSMDDAERWSMAAFCSDPVNAVTSSDCRTRKLIGVGEQVTQVKEALTK